MGNTSTDRPVVGVDLGGTKILAGVIGADGKILSLAKRPTKAKGGVEVVTERIARTIRDAVESADLELRDVSAVGLGAPGPLDPDEGVILNAPNLVGFDNVPLSEMLRKNLDLPVFIENDVNLGTLGEFALGAGQGARDVVGIFVGTGIGGGLILDGVLRQGWRRTAAEVGHMIVLADGPVCGCGKRGCVEALASRTAIERDIWAGIHAGRESSLRDLMSRDKSDRLTSGQLAEAHRNGDPLVIDVIARAQFYLGLLVASVVNFVDPQMVIVAGGVAEAFGDGFLEPIRRVAYQYFINQRNAREVGILPALLGDNAVLLGAAVLAKDRLARA